MQETLMQGSVCGIGPGTWSKDTRLANHQGERLLELVGRMV
ncbi:hypothetical protein LCGC14_2174670 [marine sediment metagenome]|uniref:Uncharacterized protein n=1 Tax=marine sediment metagenome TaxID=412755 RepID=A0A0F9EB96_9ZZZZ